MHHQWCISSMVARKALGVSDITSVALKCQPWHHHVAMVDHVLKLQS